MDRKAVIVNAKALLVSGTPKSQIFTQLSGQGLSDRRLAYYLASYVDPLHCLLHSGKVNAAVTLMLLQSALYFVVFFLVSHALEPIDRWLISTGAALIPLLFAWGFYRHSAMAFNIFLALNIAFFSKLFSGFSVHSMLTWIGPVLNISLFVFIFYVRQTLFPDFMWMSPKKIKGTYVFKH